eukprot:1808503-Pleurochrysis_carterae.AAC.2
MTCFALDRASGLVRVPRMFRVAFLARSVYIRYVAGAHGVAPGREQGGAQSDAPRRGYAHAAGTHARRNADIGRSAQRVLRDGYGR